MRAFPDDRMGGLREGHTSPPQDGERDGYDCNDRTEAVRDHGRSSPKTHIGSHDCITEYRQRPRQRNQHYPLKTHGVFLSTYFEDGMRRTRIAARRKDITIPPSNAMILPVPPWDFPDCRASRRARMIDVKNASCRSCPRVREVLQQEQEIRMLGLSRLCQVRPARRASPGEAGGGAAEHVGEGVVALRRARSGDCNEEIGQSRLRGGLCPTEKRQARKSENISGTALPDIPEGGKEISGAQCHPRKTI